METLSFEYRGGHPLAGAHAAGDPGRRRRLRQPRGAARARPPRRMPARSRSRPRPSASARSGRRCWTTSRPRAGRRRAHLHQRRGRHARRRQPAPRTRRWKPAPEANRDERCQAQLYEDSARERLAAFSTRAASASSCRRRAARGEPAPAPARPARRAFDDGVDRRARAAGRQAGARRRAGRRASWAAPSARCTAPSSSACCERALDERPAAVLLLVEIRRRAPARGQCRR